MSETQQLGQTLEVMLGGLVERAVRNATADLAVQLRTTRPEKPLDDLGIDPMRAYTVKEVAQMLGTKRVASVYEIPEEELPRVKRIGSHLGFLGINVLCYMHGLPPVDVAALVERYRERLIQDRPKVQPLRTVENGKTRVL